MKTSILSTIISAVLVASPVMANTVPPLKEENGGIVAKWEQFAKTSSSRVAYITAIPKAVYTIEVCGLVLNNIPSPMYSMYVQCRQEYLLRGNQIKVIMTSGTGTTTQLAPLNDAGHITNIKLSPEGLPNGTVPSGSGSQFPDFTVFYR